MLTARRAFFAITRINALRQLSTVADIGSVQQLETFIASEPSALVFSKTTCPFCLRTKNLFESLGESPTVVELDVEANGASVQNLLAELTGQRSVPNVFIGGQHVGGNDDTHAAHASGDLEKLLAATK